MANGYKKTTTRKTARGGRKMTRRTGGSSNSAVAKLSKDAYHTEIIKGYKTLNADANHKIIATLPCTPKNLTAEYPQWGALATKYEQFRVVYASATIVFSDQSKTVMSIVERDETAISGKDLMVKDPLCKVHVIDANQKQVFRGWKPSVSADYDFQNTDLSGLVPAYIKMLQTDVQNQTAEVFLTLKVQFRNAKN